MPIFSNDVILFNDEAFIGKFKKRHSIEFGAKRSTYNTVLAWVKALGTRLNLLLTVPLYGA